MQQDFADQASTWYPALWVGTVLGPWPCLPVSLRAEGGTSWEGHNPPGLSHFPSRRAEESRVQVRMYRCSSLSISFRWIPNFCRGRAQESEGRSPGQESWPAVTPFPPEHLLAGNPKSWGGAKEEQMQRHRPLGSSGTGRGKGTHFRRQGTPESPRRGEYMVGAPRWRSQARLPEQAGPTLGL